MTLGRRNQHFRLAGLNLPRLPLRRCGAVLAFVMILPGERILDIHELAMDFDGPVKSLPIDVRDRMSGKRSHLMPRPAWAGFVKFTFVS